MIADIMKNSLFQSSETNSRYAVTRLINASSWVNIPTSWLHKPGFVNAQVTTVHLHTLCSTPCASQSKPFFSYLKHEKDNAS